jgi:hypothetical protein
MAEILHGGQRSRLSDEAGFGTLGVRPLALDDLFYLEDRLLEFSVAVVDDVVVVVDVVEFGFEFGDAAFKRPGVFTAASDETGAQASRSSAMRKMKTAPCGAAASGRPGRRCG